MLSNRMIAILWKLRLYIVKFLLYSLSEEFSESFFTLGFRNKKIITAILWFITVQWKLRERKWKYESEKNYACDLFQGLNDSTKDWEGTYRLRARRALSMFKDVLLRLENQKSAIAVQRLLQ